MIERFTGEDGNRRFLDSLLRQGVVLGNIEIATALTESSELMGITRGTAIINQDAQDNDLFLILTGAFSIIVNGREVARRRPGEHVGEMALIDVRARRAATVVALEDSVVAKISEPAFSALAAKHPEMWRRLALELADRLRQRNALVKDRNVQPHIFIGSTVESLEIAHHLQLGLEHDPFIVKVWTDHVFGASDFSIESLESSIEEADFAVLVCSPEDKVIVRDEEHSAPRDNVVFETGLFMGALGRRRVYLVIPSGIKTKLPTDLLGLTPITYSAGSPKDLATRLDPVCTEIRKQVTTRGPK